MIEIKRIITTVAMCLIVMSVFASQANAYIDTSTGSYIIQILLAGLMGILLTVKIFWKRVRMFFGKHRSEDDKTEDKAD